MKGCQLFFIRQLQEYPIDNKIRLDMKYKKVKQNVNVIFKEETLSVNDRFKIIKTGEIILFQKVVMKSGQLTEESIYKTHKGGNLVKLKTNEVERMPN